MTKPRRMPAKIPAPASPRQMSIAFESKKLLGLSPSERMKVLAHLSNLLMLAAGAKSTEDSDER